MNYLLNFASYDHQRDVSALESLFNIIAFTIRGLEDAEEVVKYTPDLFRYRCNRAVVSTVCGNR
jgi:hypothetical protein